MSGLALSSLLRATARFSTALFSKERTGSIAVAHTITVEDLFRLHVITDAEISPDGCCAAYVLKRAHLDDNCYRSAIYVVQLDVGDPAAEFQLTGDDSNSTTPRWSPDGHALAFVSDRSGVPQIYLAEVGAPGSAPRQLTNLDRGASAPVWSPDGSRIACLSTAGNGLDDEERKQPGGPIRHITRKSYRFDGAGFGDGRFSHIWVFDVVTGAGLQLTAGEHDDMLPAWSPDGRRIAFVSNRLSEANVGFYAQVYVVPATPGAQPVTAPDQARCVSHGTETAEYPAWSPDGTEIAYIGRHVGAPAGANTDIYVVSAAGGADAHILTAGFDRGVGTGVFGDTWSNYADASLFWGADEILYFTACNRGRVWLFRVSRETGVTSVIGGDRTVGFVSLARGTGRLAYVAGDFTNPCDLYTSQLDGSDERRLTSINAAVLDDLAIQLPQLLQVEGPAPDAPVDAWLMRPAGYIPEHTYPLVQYIHGGPHSTFGHTFFFDMQLWASQGWNVLFVNPRASQGYGEYFATCNIGRWGGGDWPELERALDAAVQLGGVDTSRLAVTGLSYGGYMTNWIIGHTTRFCTAISENGLSNLVSFYGTSDIGWHWLERELGMEIWGNLDAYMRLSPISYVPAMGTPLLLIQAEDDGRCPIEQGEQLFTALRARDVPCEMVRFPGESHLFLVFGKPQLRLQRRQHMLRWLRRYLESHA